MRIGELSREVGIASETLRRLARIGIIPAKRLPGKRANWRFAQSDVERIKTILFDAGLIEEEPAKAGKRKAVQS